MKEVKNNFYFEIAYFFVHDLAVSSCSVLSVLYKFAIGATSGSSGFGSVNKLQMDKNTLFMETEGFQLSCFLKFCQNLLKDQDRCFQICYLCYNDIFSF
jgi:hypothetical protein